MSEVSQYGRECPVCGHVVSVRSTGEKAANVRLRSRIVDHMKQTHSIRTMIVEFIKNKLR